MLLNILSGKGKKLEATFAKLLYTKSGNFAFPSVFNFLRITVLL